MAVTQANKVAYKTYGPDVLISPHTNKLVPEGVQVPKTPVFWCEICSLKLSTPTQAIQHLTGKAHKSKVNAKNQIGMSDFLKRKGSSLLGAPENHLGPAVKRSKLEADQKGAVDSKKGKGIGETYRCDTCKIQLNSMLQYGQHLKSTKHKLVEQGVPREELQGRGNRGRGRGAFRGGMGRGDTSFRGGYGSMRGAISYRGGLGSDNSFGARGRGGIQRGGLQRGFKRGMGSTRADGGGSVLKAGGQYGKAPKFSTENPNFQPVGEKAAVPGAKKLLSEYFVQSSQSNDFFKPEQKPPMKSFYDNKTPADYYSNQSSSNFNPPRNESRNKYFDNMRGDYYGNHTPSKDYYGPSPPQQPPKDYYGNIPSQPKDYYGGTSGGSQKEMYGNAPPLPPKDYYGGPSPPPPPPKDVFSNQSGNYYSNGYSSNNYTSSTEGYGNKPGLGEYRMNTDATYDSFYV